MSKKDKLEQNETEQTELETKKKKVKVIYYDDGSTVVDMSITNEGKKRPDKLKSTRRERRQTFFAVMRRMIVPMLCTLAAFTLIYIFLLAITGNLF